MTKELCKGSAVEPVKDLERHGIQHSGVLTHKCMREVGKHPINLEGNEICKCACPYTWVKNFR